MKKILALYCVPLLVFAISLGILNYKYDPLYRLNGIDNETRQHIINNMSDDEQNYLIENSIPTHRFARFCKYYGFNIYELEYYETLEVKLGLQDDSFKVVKHTNNILSKLKDNPLKQQLFNQLIDLDLVEQCVQNDEFNFAYIDYYLSYYQEVPDCDKIAVIPYLNTLIEGLNLESDEFFKQYASDYDIDGLMLYYNQKMENPDLTLVDNPASLTTIVLENQTLANYEPSPLMIPYEVSRVRFLCYLRKDACESVVELAKDVEEHIADETLLIVDGYEKKDGTSEDELGLTVDFMVLNIDYHDFSSTRISAYLQENAYKYGFVLRYDPSQNCNTYRYVGKNPARLMKQHNLTLEEYEGVIDE